MGEGGRGAFWLAWAICKQRALAGVCPNWQFSNARRRRERAWTFCRHDLLLENETKDDATQAISVTLVTTETTGHRVQ